VLAVEARSADNRVCVRSLQVETADNGICVRSVQVEAPDNLVGIDPVEAEIALDDFRTLFIDQTQSKKAVIRSDPTFPK
jgi:hypothetical protein